MAQCQKCGKRVNRVYSDPGYCKACHHKRSTKELRELDRKYNLGQLLRKVKE